MNKESLITVSEQDCKILKEFRKETNSLRDKTRIYYLIQTPFGNCIMRKDNYPSKLPSILSAVSPTEYFINQSNKVHNNTYDYTFTEYKGSRNSVKISCKIHGIFEQAAHTHLAGKGCSVCGIEKRTKNLSSCKEKLQKESDIKHNREYEIIGEYLGSQSKIKILHKVCGTIIEQTPAGHLQGNRCPHCNKATGWSVKNWIKASKSSKSFDSYKIYIIKCTNSSESFIKIGRTFQKTKQRFSSKTKMPYNIEIIKEIIYEDAKDCFSTEKKLLTVFKKHSYTPKLYFNGMYECFDTECLTDILSFIRS